MTDQTLTELSEMLTIPDYQSVMESKITTNGIPTARDDIINPTCHMSKTQNM